MVCAFHPQTVASGSCQGCGRALCASCFARFTLPRCQTCILQSNAAIAQRIYRSLSLSAAIFVTMLTILLRLPPDPKRPASLFGELLLSLGMVLTYWSYQFLSRHMPRLVLANSFVWIAYFFVKLFLAGMISTFAGPYQIFKALRELQVTRRTQSQLARGNI